MSSQAAMLETPRVSMPVPMMALSPVANPDVGDALQVFDRLSHQLRDAYHVLEDRVSLLNDKLEQVGAERLRELEEKERISRRLHDLLHLLPGGVVVLDNRGRVIQCNAAAVDFLGEPLEGELWRDVIERCFAPRSDDGHEVSLKDGRRVAIATRSLEAEPGQLLLLTDLTETRKLQERLSRNQRLAALGRMVASLAHQIRTPVSAALLYASHLARGESLPQEQIQRFANKIVSRLNHLEEQVRDMLVFAKGDIKLSQVVSVEDLTSQLRVAMEAPLSAYGARCEWQVQCPEVQLLCNAPVMVGALMNLVNNALQASGDGATIRIRVASASQRGIHIDVEDRGPGISQEVLLQMEEDFFTTKPNGTGLGLAVARAVARAHHGEFFIQSELGQGTRAGFLLPRHGAAIWEADV